MVPILFTVFDIPVYSHGFFTLLGLLVGVAWLVVESRRRHWPKEEVVPIGMAAFVGGMIGARVSIVFFNGSHTAPAMLDFYRMFDSSIGLGSILGGVIGAYIAGYIASRMIGKAGCTCDAFAPALALAMSIGRIGCYLSFEDGLGKPTTLPWGVRVPAEAGSYLVHPTPLYDAGFNLVWFAILLLLRDHPRMQNGNLLKVGVAGYAVFRFLVEFVRNNQILLWGLTGQQFACLILLAALALYYIYQWRHAQRKIALAMG
jgi:phosphatidylglycerol---prolipoprotein diacylglyceryl transferase